MHHLSLLFSIPSIITQKYLELCTSRHLYSCHGFNVCASPSPNSYGNFLKNLYPSYKETDRHDLLLTHEGKAKKQSIYQPGKVIVVVSRSISGSVVTDSLRPHRVLCPWNSPGKNTIVGCHALFQVIFPTQGSNPGLPHCGHILYLLSHQEAQENGSYQNSTLLAP